MAPTDEMATPVEALGAAIGHAQAADPFAPVLIIVPSPFVRVQLRRIVGARRGICNVEFRTWNEFTSDLAEMAAGRALRRPNPRTVDETLRQVLLSSSSPFGSFAGSPIARKELAALLQELWRADPSLLVSLGTTGSRAHALVELLGAVEAHLSEHGFVDAGRVLDLAAQAPVDPETFGAVMRWYPRPSRGRDAAVLGHLFDQGIAVTTFDTDRTGEIDHLVQCGDPDEEVRVVSRRIIGALDEGVPLWRQAIVHPPAERYRRMVHRQLAASGVPTSGISPMTLARSATGRALIGVLGLAEGGWRRSDLIGWLMTAPVTTGARGRRAPVHRWDDISARAGVVEGLDQWRLRLHRFAAGGSPRNQHVAQSDAESRSAESIVEFVERLAVDLESPSGRWSDMASWAIRLLDVYLHPDDRASDWPSIEIVAAEQVREAVDALGDLDEVGPVTDLVAFRQAVETELDSRPARDDDADARPSSEGEPPLRAPGLPGPVGAGVFVGTPTEARGLAFDRIYVIGLADQFLPGAARGTSLLPEAELDHADWPTAQRRSEELLEDLRSVLALGGRPCTATWPLVDPRTGRENGPSRWLDHEGGLRRGWATETVPSFAAHVVSGPAVTLPLSAPDRLLGDLARWVAEGIPVEKHPAMRGRGDSTSGRQAPLSRSIDAARSPLVAAFGRFEGNIGPGIVRGVSGEVSPTRLEEYAKCPRRYLLGRELRLSAPFRPEETEQMEAADRGTLLHRILASYVDGRISGSPPSLDRLIQMGEHEFGQAEEEGRCGGRLMAAVERSRLVRELRRWFEEDTLEPVAAELFFGSGGAAEDDVADDRLDAGPEQPAAAPRTDAVELELADGRTIRFHGWVDRIDRKPDGTIVVSDYKTGRQLSLRELLKDPVAGGTKLQLPIYALAARAYLEWDGPVMARYWLTSYEREDPSFVCTLEDALLERLREVLTHIATGIDSGAFPGYPGEETYRGRRPTFENCAYCEFDRLCPTDRDRRWALAEDAPEVGPVRALTEEPADSLKEMVRKSPVDLRGAG